MPRVGGMDHEQRAGIEWGPIIGALGTIAGTALTVREARRNREWQEQMANTAHQREVADLRAAGINPLMTAGGSGSATPPGNVGDFEGLSRAVINALTVKQMQANVKLTDAQGDKTKAETLEVQQRAGYERNLFPGRMDAQWMDNILKQLDVTQRRELLQTVVDQAKADLDLTRTSARSTRAVAELDELARKGAVNSAEVEEILGKGSPAFKLFMELLRSAPRLPNRTTIIRR